jgi:hypothetical protein
MHYSTNKLPEFETVANDCDNCGSVAHGFLKSSPNPISQYISAGDLIIAVL